MPLSQGLAPILGMQLGTQPGPSEGYELVQKVKGPRRLLMDILRQDPEMEEMLKKLRLKGSDNATSMESDYGPQG